MTVRARVRLTAAAFAAVWAIGVPAALPVHAATALALPAGRAPQCMPPATEVVPAVPWAQTRLAYQSVWHLTRGEGVTVAVIDTGVDARVRQLQGRVLPGLDIVNGSGAADRDCAGHGTFVAGIIAAAPRSGVGFAGVAPSVGVLPIRQTNDNRDGSLAGMATAIRAAVDAGASVVNVSTGAFAPVRALREAVRYAVAHDVLIIAAANEVQADGVEPDTVVSDSIVEVAAVAPNDGAASRSGGRAHVDLAAPGTDVLSLGPGGPGHLIGSGLGYAAAFVSGVAALVRAYHPELTVAQVMRRLTLTADHPGGRLPDPLVGWGVVNPYNAVASVISDETGPAAVIAAPRVLTAPPIPRKNNRNRDMALTVAGIAAGLAVAAALGAAVVGRGHRRRWQPASASVDTQALAYLHEMPASPPTRSAKGQVMPPRPAEDIRSAPAPLPAGGRRVVPGR